MTTEAYEQMYKIADKHWWFIGKGEIVEQAIRQNLPKSDNVKLLDAGCGFGNMLKRYEKYGEAYGFEFSEKAIELTNKDNPRVKQGALPDKIPFENGQFDIVTSLDVLEHVDEDKQSADALLKLLKPNGTLIVTVPAYMSHWSNHDVALHHKRRYTKKTLLALFDLSPSSNLKLVKITHFNSFLCPPIYVFRKLKKIFMPNAVTTDDKL
ncbi:MAG: class I SAM-dependent methyltransferase, partial [Oscillospiraceae bacterium]|nr:class I SAM-dependent methyltransferase [Oscillospiraceae bacterium]